MNQQYIKDLELKVEELENIIKRQRKEIKKLKEEYEEVKEYLRIEISNHIEDYI